MSRYWTEFEVYVCKGGNQQLARKLAEAIGGERIFLRGPADSLIIKRGSGLADRPCEWQNLGSALTIW